MTTANTSKTYDILTSLFQSNHRGQNTPYEATNIMLLHIFLDFRNNMDYRNTSKHLNYSNLR